MIRYLSLLTFTFLTCCGISNAQSTLQGKVYEIQTHIALQSVRVTNLNSKQFTVTDTAGMFYLYAKPGDLLTFRGYAYQSDTVVITNKNRLEVYMQPAGKVLNEVNIATTQSTAGSLKDPTLTGAPLAYQRDANGNYQGGIALRFGYGKNKKAIHSKQLSDEEITQQDIDYAFTPQKISKLIPLRGQDMQNFLIMYRPQDKVFKDPKFDLTLYVNDCYKMYMALPADKRKPVKLLQDTLKQ